MAKMKKIKGREGWYVDYRDAAGKRIIRKAADAREEAKHVLGQVMAREAQRRHAKRHGGEVKRLPNDAALADIRDRYLRHVRIEHREKPQTVESYTMGINDVLGFLAERGILQVGQLSTDSIIAFQEKRLTEPRKITFQQQGRTFTRSVKPLGERTVNIHVGAFVAALRWAADRNSGNMIDGNPLAGIKPLKVRRKRVARRAMTRNEKRALLACSHPLLRHVWAMFLGTGLRKAELASLKWADVDLDRGQIVVRAGVSKNSETATLPLRRDLWEMLADMHEKRQTDHVFVNSEGRPWGVSLTERFNECLAAAGIPKYSAEGSLDIHALRTTFGTDLVAGGVDVRTVQSLMRHKTPTITLQFYARVKQSNLRPAVENIPLDMPVPDSTGTPETGNKVETIRHVAIEQLSDAEAITSEGTSA